MVSNLYRFYLTIFPFGAGPGSEVDLVSVMNGMGNGNKDEVRGTNLMSALLPTGQFLVMTTEAVPTAKDSSGRPLGTIFATSQGRKREVVYLGLERLRRTLVEV
jgi:hypothetical protein